jgi:hypothetical protein
MKKLNLIAAILIAASSAFAQVPSYVPTNGLVGWWPFNGNANDDSGNGNNGTVNGSSLTSDRFGNANNAYNFNGSSNYIEVSSSSSISVSTNYSISVWLNANIWSFNAPIDQHAVVSKIDNGDWYGGYEIRTGGGGYIMHSGNIGSNFDIGKGNYSTNNWNNVTVTYDGNYVRSFINGILVDSIARSGAIQTSSIPLRFGRRGGAGYYNNWFSGKIDDVAIWNRALSQQEITSLYNAQTCNSSSNTITADGPTTFCAGNFVNLKSDVVGGTYQWRRNGVNISTNAISRTFKGSSTGSYTCVATCNGTALTSNAIAVTSKTNASATVSASGATSFCAGDSVTLNATNLGSNYSVQWYRTNVSMENATNYSQVVKQPGTYKVVTRNLTNGCSRISGSAITTNVNCRIAGDVTSGAVIQENTNLDSRFIDNELSQEVHIYPNPNSGVFSFNYDGEETGDAVLQVINNMGQSIYQSRLTIPEGGFTQDLQLGDNISKGIYIVRLLINDSYHDSKVMVK